MTRVALISLHELMYLIGLIGQQKTKKEKKGKKQTIHSILRNWSLCVLNDFGALIFYPLNEGLKTESQ